MPLLAADPVIVEPAQREALEALVRARMILQAADAVGVRESARELDVWPKTVRYGASAGVKRPMGSRCPSGSAMRRARARRQHTHPSRFAR